MGKTVELARVNEAALREAVIELYRRELRRRYQLKNVRKFAEFDSLNDHQLEELRDYFLTAVYPPPDKRARLDEAFDHLGDIFGSPRRVKTLLGMAIRSVWRLGAKLPSAISAGLSTVDAYREARKLETIMLRNAKKQGITLEDTGNRERMLQLIIRVPDKDVLRLIHDVLNLFHSLSNVPLLSATVEIMDKSLEIMNRQPDVFPEHERDGLALGLEVLRGGLNLFKDIPPDQFPALIKGIESVELDWYHTIKAE